MNDPSVLLESHAQRIKRQYCDNVDFVDNCQTNFRKSKSSDDYCEWNDTVTIKINASDNPDKEYRSKFGVHFLDESTFIVGDEYNNVLLVYQDDDKVVTKNVTSLIRVQNKFRLDHNCIIHKKLEPAKVPPHIRVHLTYINNQNNNTIVNNNNIINNFHNLNISSSESTQHANTIQSYLDIYFKKGGMCSIKQLSRYPEWKKEYRHMLETRKMNICKSCKEKWIKGCCSDYSRYNRTQLVMVIGWHE